MFIILWITSIDLCELHAFGYSRLRVFHSMPGGTPNVTLEPGLLLSGAIGWEILPVAHCDHIVFFEEPNGKHSH